MSYGLTAEGFNRKTYEVVLAEMQARARGLFGDDVNLSENSPLGLFIEDIAYFLASGDTEDPGLWELAEDVYNSGYVDTAEGAALDAVVKYAGLKRKQAEPSTSPGFIINGTDGTTISAGYLVATHGGIQFKTSSDVTISSGSATVDIEAVNGGANTNVPANTITVIVNPIAGVTSVNNPNAATGGTDAETDEELRDRYYQSVSKPGASTADSIRASLLSLSGVRDAIVRVNNTMNTVDGIPPKSIAPIVFGGTDNDIAQKILETKAAGIQSYGTTNVTLTDSSGNTQTIGFTKNTVVNVWVRVTLTTDSSFPTDGNNLVRTAIIKYIGGTDADLTEYDGLGLGDDVIWAKCISVALEVDGITDITLELSTDGTTYSTSNITISTSEVAKTDYSKVVIS